MKRSVMALGLLLAATYQLALIGCTATSENTIPSSDAVSNQVKTFTVRGIVKGVKSDGSMISIHHEAIPGYMMSMTMPFFVKDPQEAMPLAEGDGIEFEYYVNGNQSHIANIRRVDPSEIRVSE